MTLQEDTYDVMVDHAVQVNKYALSQRKELLSEIAFVLNELKGKLLVGKKTVSLSDFNKMQSTVNTYITEQFKLIKKNIYQDAYDLMDVEIDIQVQLLQDLIDKYELSYRVRTPSKTKIKRNIDNSPIKGMTISDWLDVWELKLKALINSTMHTAYTNTDNRVEIVDSLGTEENPLTSDIMRVPANNMNGLLLAIFDSAMSETTKGIADVNTGIIEGVIWNSCLCPTTCISCASLHGSIRYFDGEDETDGAEIPLHPSCMCIWVYKYKDADKMSFYVPKAIQPNINADVDPKTFPVWYNSISEQRKVELFGKTRTRMLEEGKIKPNQLLTTDRRLYTLDQLSTKGYSLPE